MDTGKLVGQQIDQYHIVRHIARGGMADVYLAEDIDLERKVALKVMLAALATADPQFAERFRREAKTVARLDHPNIVQVYTVGQTPTGQPYIAMQYIEGGSLQKKLKELADRKKLLTTEQALNIVRQIALALGAAHEAGIVHRDLKPANVLVRPDGVPVLVDLGIAAIKGGAKLTQTGSVIGTPAYMSPEQVRGGTLDGRADLYALGIILYEILAGIRPFDAEESIAVLHKQVYEEPLPLNSFRSDLSVQTLDIVATTLQKDPGHRYQSAEEMVRAIDAAIQSEGFYAPNPQATAVLTQMNDSALLSRSRMIQTPLPPEEEKAARLAIPRWAIALLLLLATASFLFFAFRSSGPVNFADVTPTKNSAVAQQPTASANDTTTTNNRSMTISETETAVSQLAAGDDPLEPASTTIPPTNAPPTPTNTASPTPTTVPSPTVTAVNPFPDGLLAYSCGIGTGNRIYLDSPDGGSRTILSNQPGNSIVPAFSPDGRQITYRSDAGSSWQIYVSDVDGANLRQVTAGGENNNEAVWSPDGGQFAFVSDRDGSRQIYVMNSDGSNQWRLTANNDFNDDPSWSVNGQIIYESNENGRYSIFQISPQGGVPIELITWGDSSNTPAWSPDGQWLAFESRSGDDRHIWIAYSDGSGIQQITAHGSEDERPAWSPDGTKIAFHSNYQQADPDWADIWVIDITTKAVQRITFQGGCRNPSWELVPADMLAGYRY